MSATTSRAEPVTVSIITPCYNGASFLEHTLRSAIGQSRPPLEILVVDDGSTDDSADLARRFGPPVRVISQPNQGESVARNRGMEEAKGTHVLFLDADDLLAPLSLERLVAALDDGPRTVAVMGCAWFETDPNQLQAARLTEATAFYPAVIGSNLAPPHCWLTPLSVVREVGGFASALRWFEDWDLWWRVGLTGATLVKTDYIGALYRQHPNSQLATTSMINRTRGHAAVMARMANEILRRPTLLALYGAPMFWNAWTALRRARANGVPWSELHDLRQCVLALARQGPSAVTSARTARVVRFLGPRAAVLLERNA